MAGRCNASQDAQDAWDAGDASLASGRNADGSDAGSVFADGNHGVAKAEHNTSPVPSMHDSADRLFGLSIRHLIASNPIVTRDLANADRTKAIEQGCQDLPHPSGLTLRLHLCNTYNGRDAVRKDDDHSVEV